MVWAFRGGRAKLSYMSIRYFVEKSGAGRNYFGEGAEVMTTEKIFFWGKTWTGNAGSSWVCKPNLFSAWRNYARDQVGKLVRLIFVKSISPTLDSAWYGFPPHQETANI